MNFFTEFLGGGVLESLQTLYFSVLVFENSTVFGFQVFDRTPLPPKFQQKQKFLQEYFHLLEKAFLVNVVSLPAGVLRGV